MFRVVVPQIFENMEEATIGHWLVSEGQQIQKEQSLCELITEKTTLELPSEAAGQLLKLVVPEKAVVPAGFIIALIGEAGDELPDVDAENAALKRTASTAVVPEIPAPSAPKPDAAAPSAGGRLRATPAARRAARDVGVDLEAVAAKFPGKVLSEEDVKAFVEG